MLEAIDGKTEKHAYRLLMTLWASALRRGWLRRRDKKRD
jgi:hypothetical protein